MFVVRVSWLFQVGKVFEHRSSAKIAVQLYEIFPYVLRSANQIFELKFV